MDTVHIALGVATGLAAAIFVERAILYYRKHLRSEAARMEVATEALRKHREAVAALIENKTADRRVVLLALTMSEFVTSQEAGRDLVAFLADAAEGKAGTECNPEIEELLEQAYADEKVRAQFGAAIRHGMVAMTMQWQDTSRQLRALAEIAGDDSREVVRAAASIRRPVGGGLSGMQSAFAPA